jgi:hypothetical protein
MVSTQQVQNLSTKNKILSTQQAETDLSTKNSLHQASQHKYFSTKNSLHQQAKQTPQLMCHQNPVYEHEDLEKNLGTIKLSRRSPSLSPPIPSFSGICKVRKYYGE